ncbi:peptidase S8/S53 domain-containing protein [Lentinula raphanica]|uniref:Peptidase S8/S53 domain-containing protein n=1 Tax=Lentinula raphanica TaxID=153919 RepID=A0AA38U7Q5_9AGAR|nr:peptidase S8/S53 domain-containing protein [Lentinula raphanica]KAJ3833922.1 peptidase S8/S53 domain-containing protein [Lentinula raphanica]KAJ3975070.1 peptidase S8/S53 domain-containing protein [Lentinula raphanica]
MSSFTYSLLALSLAATAYTSPLSTNYHNAPAQRSSFLPAPLIEEDHLHGTINNSYIVKFKDGLSSALVQNHFNFLQNKHAETPLVDENSGLRHIYDSLGYSGFFHNEVVDYIRSMPEVEYVERDQIVRTSDEVLVNPSITHQRSAPWGLARTSHRKKLTLGTFTKYDYVTYAGDGVDVYVIDTGIYISHPEFSDRAHWGITIPQNDVDEDANGHGTHCAGTIASDSYGVAKKAEVYAVKVLGSNGSGTMSDVIKGVEWATNSAVAKAKAGSSKHKGSVANMSLGGGKSPTLDTAVNRATEKGLHFAVAAGNENRDACNSSPAAAEKAITVGASTISDERAYFSNYGPCVDVFAPGLNIKSTWPNNGINTISGTSMASPHTAGLLAYLLSIYPSVPFNPEVSNTTSPSAKDSEQQYAFTSMYKVLHAALPRIFTAFMPSPESYEEATAPIPPKTPKTLSAAQLKQAVLSLATKGMITGDLPTGTPNLLIFNNATTA